MKALVTGGEGFIGRNIIDLCRSKGWETISLDIAEGESNADVKIIGSVLDLPLLRKITKDVDYVFHEAAMTSPPQFEQTPTEGFEINTEGTLRVLQASKECGVRRVVLASSSAIYGNAMNVTKESDKIPNFINHYPLTKHFNELTAKFYTDNFQLDTVCLRYFNTYGKGENSKGFYSSVIHKFIGAIRNKESPVIFGDGSQSRDFIYVKDTARANILAAEKGKGGTVYNVGTGVTTSFNDIFRLVSELMEVNVVPSYEPIPFKTYQMFTQADISKIKMDLSFEPEYDLRKGIKEMIETR
jgi:UDP-glucose 4-epimerase